MTKKIDMNNAFFLPKEAASPQWRIIDVEGEVLGRVATKIADILRGKDKPYYTRLRCDY
jgi:large subunit ribosomal protein L13